MSNVPEPASQGHGAGVATARRSAWQGADDDLVNVPHAATPLVGREADVIAVRALLADGARLVTITGPGGVGRTRLALATAREAGPRFADGASFADLAPVADPDLVVAAVARAVGARETGEQPPLADLLEYLRDRELLLVLDNFEHLQAAAPVVSAILAACPDVALLATSRTLLRLTGEHAYRCEPLALPAGSSLPEVEASRRFGCSWPGRRPPHRISR